MCYCLGRENLPPPSTPPPLIYRLVGGVDKVVGLGKSHLPSLSGGVGNIIIILPSLSGGGR